LEERNKLGGGEGKKEKKGNYRTPREGGIEITSPIKRGPRLFISHREKELPREGERPMEAARGTPLSDESKVLLAS